MWWVLPPREMHVCESLSRMILDEDPIGYRDHLQGHANIAPVEWVRSTSAGHRNRRVGYNCFLRVIGFLIVCQAVVADEPDLTELFDDIVNSPPPPAADYGPRYEDTIETTELTLTVKGIDNDNGKIVVLVYDDAQAYSTGNYAMAVAFIERAASSGTKQFSLRALSAGPYAVFLYHDANGDSDLNMQGSRPLEGFGYSGGVYPMPPPSFEQAAVVTDEASIRVVYIPAWM